MLNEEPEVTSVAQLGYIGFEVSDLAAWEAFACGVLGLQLVERRANGGMSFRMDSYYHRIIVDPGASDDVSIIGFEVNNDAELEEISGRLKAGNFPVTEGTPAECAIRHVKRLVKYTDPAGNPSELFIGPEKSPEPFKSAVVLSSFVADKMGLGHCVVSAKNQQESIDFYTNVLGFKLSDYIKTEFYGHKVNIAFLHTNPRHHTIAVGEGQRKRIHHFMLEVKLMDDVGLAFDRCLKSGIKIFQTLGRHPNDRMFSFYAFTPSGFQFEFGWGGREIDDSKWQTTTYDHISEWGHHPTNIFAPKKDPAKETVGSKP